MERIWLSSSAVYAWVLIMAVRSRKSVIPELLSPVGLSTTLSSEMSAVGSVSVRQSTSPVELDVVDFPATVLPDGGSVGVGIGGAINFRIGRSGVIEFQAASWVWSAANETRHCRVIDLQSFQEVLELWEGLELGSRRPLWLWTPASPSLPSLRQYPSLAGP